MILRWISVAISCLLYSTLLDCQTSTPKFMAVHIVPLSGSEGQVASCRAGVVGAAQHHGYQVVPLGSRPGIPILHIKIDIINVSHSDINADASYDRDVRVAAGGWEMEGNKFAGMVLATDNHDRDHMDVLCVAVLNGLLGG